MLQDWEVPGARVERRPRREESRPLQARLLRAMGAMSPEAKAVMSLECRSAAVLGMEPRARVGRGRTSMVLYMTTLLGVVSTMAPRWYGIGLDVLHRFPKPRLEPLLP